MKKTQRTALLRDIRRTWVSFLSIIVFVSLGVAIFLGVKWNEPALGRAMDSYLDGHGYHDLQLAFPYGFTAEDVAAVAAADGVDAVEGAYNAYGTTEIGGDRYILNIQSLTETMDKAEALEGTLPTADDEIAVERLLADALDLHLGDRISITALRGDKSCLKSNEFTVSAIVEHPSFTRLENDYTRGFCTLGDGAADGYVLVAKAAFEPDAFDGCYPQLLIRGAGLEELETFGSAYQQQVSTLKETIEALGAERAAARSDGVYDRAGEQIADAEEQLAQGEKELADGRQQYTDREKQLADAERQIADGEREIAENEKKLADGKQQYEDGLAAYASGAAQLRNGYASLVAKLEENGYPTDLTEAEAQLTADKAKAVKAKDLLERLQVQLEIYNRKPDDIDENEVANILLEALGSLSGSDGQSPIETIEELQAAIDAAQEYLKAYDQDEDVTQAINSLLTWLGLSADQEGANKLAERLDTVKKYIDKYAEDHDALAADIRLTLLVLILTDSTPDLSGVPEMVEQIQDKVDDSIAQLEEGLDGIAQYRAGQEALSAASAQLAQARQQIEEGEQQLADAKQQLAQAKRDYADGAQKLAQARQDITEGEQTLAENAELLDDAKAELAGFIRYDQWTIQTRTDNPSVSTAKFYAQSSRRLCYSMALLFVFVGLMVCFTSVTRNVNEAQTITGVQKSLGFRRREILTHYMAYSLLAAVIGILAGYAIGFFGIETVINDAYAKMFSIGKIPNVYTIPEPLVIAAAEIALIALATWLPCRKLLRRPAVELLKGNNYTGGRTRFYEKWRLWQHLSLYTKTTINNLMNDGARVIATLVGIAGCTALVVMSLSLKMAIQDTPVRHFKDIWTYDASLVSDTAVPGGHEALREVLERNGVDYASVRREAMYIQDETGALSKTDLIIPEDPENMVGYIHLDDWRTGRTLPLTDDGVIVSCTYAKHHDLKVGDTLRLMDTSGCYYECVVSGISQHYLSNIQVVMSRAYYKALMGTAAQSNTLYLHYGNADAAAVQRELRSTDGYFSLTDENAKWTAVFAQVSGSTMLVVYIGLFLSATMALLVLLNLNIVCVTEKTNELVIMRINGFSVSAVKKYIYRDNIVLTLLGILGGLGIGVLLGQWVLGILQKSGDNFYTAPSPFTLLIAAGMAAAFSLITNLIALRRINGLSVHDLTRV